MVPPFSSRTPPLPFRSARHGGDRAASLYTTRILGVLAGDRRGNVMLDRVISGGQTGADQAGLRAARAAGIPTGGWAPLGWETEDGPSPWLADFGLIECREPGYPARTRANVLEASATIWLGSLNSPGSLTTHSRRESRGQVSVRRRRREDSTIRGRPLAEVERLQVVELRRKSRVVESWDWCQGRVVLARSLP
jgi:hypothetical protein